ncbi:MAG TPA: DEAD/DEAH box helicase, partial [Burkholderiales bacterium]|nr:DEAD/DEAH box helicase [Burkholderiales bacterium]
MKGLNNLLRRRFGLRGLRPGQREVIDSVLAGRDTLAIMPSGAGKSLCYQLPTLQMRGTTIVVSPLIALMKDQSDKLEERGVDAAAVNSALSGRERREA